VSGALQMRFHFGERDRDGDGPLDAAVMDACFRHGVRAAALMRGVEGYGAKHHLRTDRLLSLSEDTPLVAVAVGEAEVVEALAEEVQEIAAEGLIVLEPVEVLRDAADAGAVGTQTTSTPTPNASEVGVPVVRGPEDEGEGSGSRAGDTDAGARDVVRATIWGPRSGPTAPHLEAVAAFRRHGAEAATVLLGVDGVLDGERQRARFLAGNRGVPAMTVAVGDRAAVVAAFGEVDGATHLVTVEHTEGAVESSSRIAGVSHHGGATRVTLVTSEVASRGAHPVYLELIHALRREGAPGATALRGVWGYRGEGEPHGDRVLALRRDVPLWVDVVDDPDRAARWRDLALSLACEGDIVHVQSIQRAITLG
jgi:PII-like signaling protein